VPPRKINPAVPRGLEAVILKCMEKDPGVRYQSGAALAEDLLALREGRAPSAPAVPASAGAQEKTALSAGPPLTEIESSGPRTAPPGAAARDSQSSDMSSWDSAETAAAAPLRPPGQQTLLQTLAQSAPERAAAHHRASALRTLAFAVVAIAAIIGVTLLGMTLIQSRAPRPPGAAERTSPPSPGRDAGPPPPGPPGKVTPSDAAGAARGAEVKTAEVSAAKNPAAEPAPVTGLRAEISARSPVNILLRPDGEAPASHRLQAGDSLLKQAEGEIILIVDNAAAVGVKLNGKRLEPLGKEGEGVSVRLTRAGVEPIHGLRRIPDLSASRPEPPGRGERFSFGESKQPGMTRAESIIAELEESGKLGLGSKGVQAALAANPRAARLFMTSSSGVPASLFLMVRVDNSMIFRRDPEHAQLGANAEARRKPPGELPILPLNEERFLPPGRHVIHVYAGPGLRRPGATQQITGDFPPGGRRTLHIRIEPAGESPATSKEPARALPYMLIVKLE
jgi:hypothetical protein